MYQAFLAFLIAVILGMGVKNMPEADIHSFFGSLTGQAEEGSLLSEADGLSETGKIELKVIPMDAAKEPDEKSSEEFFAFGLSGTDSDGKEEMFESQEETETSADFSEETSADLAASEEKEAGQASVSLSEAESEHTHCYIPVKETVHHEAVTEILHHYAETESVYHEAVTHEVLHDEIGHYEAQEGSDADSEPEAVYVVDQPAWTETVTDQEAWTETVMVKEAWDEVVVISEAADEEVIVGWVCAVCNEPLE